MSGYRFLKTCLLASVVSLLLIFQPHAGFGQCLPVIDASDTIICAGDTVFLIDLSLGNDPHFWDIPGTPFMGVPATDTHYVFTTAGNYTVYLYYTGGPGCNDTASVPMHVIPGVTGIITLTTDEVCFGDANGTASFSASGGASPYDYLTNTAPAQMGPTVTNLAAGTYETTFTDALGCTDRQNFTINPGALIALGITPDVVICPGDIVQLLVTPSGGAGGYTYFWTPALGLNNVIIFNPIAAPLVTTQYIVTVVDANGCLATDTVTITVLEDCIWPGDADHDMVANNQDLLAIGLGYGSSGPIRLAANLNWEGQQCLDWADTLANGANYKHIDCNGDGLIDDNDTLAISLNYGLTHFKTQGLTGVGGPLLSVEFAQDSAMAGDTVLFTISLGVDTLPADSVYGIAFSVNYDNTIVDSAGFSIKFDSSWFGGPQNSLSLTKDLWLNGRAESGFTRTDHQNVTGFGQIASGGIIIVDNLDGKRNLAESLYLSLSDIRLINRLGDNLSSTFSTDSLIVQEIELGRPVPAAHSSLQLFPNPFRDQLFIETDENEFARVSLYDLSGKLIWSGEKIKEKGVIDTHDWAPGMYFLRLSDQNHTAERKIVLIR